MTDGAGGPDAGVPASIAAIMAAIRQEVGAAPTRAAPTTDDAVPDPPPIVPRAAAAAPPSMSRTSRDGAAAVPPPPLDDEVRVLLAPLLKAWLDAHLPEIVETAVHAELRRLTGLND